MSELLVIGYDSHAKATEARNALFGLSKEYMLQVGDAVIAHRNDKGEMKLDQMVNLWTVGAAGGSFWGLLAGLLFFNPLLGVVTGAAAGAVAGALGDYGINDNFMREIASVLQPGQAALFVLADRVSSDRVVERLASFGGRVIRTNLDDSQEQKVRQVIENAAKQNAEAQPATPTEPTSSTQPAPQA
jgi:uncharacterized membrane protein